MLRWCIPLLLIYMAFFSSIPIITAHEGPASQIHTLDHALTKMPHDASALQKRGTLHLEDQNWPAAQKDFSAALDLSPDNTDAACGLAIALIGQEKLEQAATLIQQILNKHPHHIRALNAQADIHLAAKRYEQAAACYGRLLSLTDTHRPDDYLQHAAALRAAGKAHFPAALKTLDKGIKKLGPLYVLVERAVDLELTLGHQKNALTRILGFEQTAAPSFRWPLWRAEIHESMGAMQDAQQSYQEALTTFSTLPTKRQNLPLFITYKTKIMTGLQRTL